MNIKLNFKRQFAILATLVLAFQQGNAQQASDAQIELFLFEDCYNYHQESYGWSSDYLNLEAASDYVLKGGGSPEDQPQLGELDKFTLTSTSSAVYAEWKNLYDGIFKCNQVLYHLNNTPTNSGFRAEAKFTRAYNYFQLVTLYGGVPLLLTLHEKVSESMVRASESEVYAQIEKDLTEALPALPLKSQLNATQKHKATKGAALTLLGDVCINQQKWAEAKAYLDQVKNSGEYSLMANFADLWLIANEHNSESIFEYEYFSTGANWANATWDHFYDNRIIQLTGPRFITSGSTGIIGSGWNLLNPTKDLADLFDAHGDAVRKNGTLITPEFLAANGASMETNCYECTGYKSKKYTTLAANTTWANGAVPELNYGQNTVKMRYADVLLLLAEAEAHLGNKMQALENINMVRARAGLPSLTPSLSDSELLEAIFTERTLEFALEGKRYRDGVRWGKADQFFGPLGYRSETNGLWPIPAQVIFENENMLQNAGYSYANSSEYSNYTQIANAFPPTIKYPWIINSPAEFKPSESTSYNYNYALEDSVLKYKFSYSYDASNLMTQYTQNWYNQATNQWQEVYKEKYEYNNSKQLILSVSFKMKSNAWDTIQARIISYPTPNIIVDSLKTNYLYANNSFGNIYVNRYTWNSSEKNYITLITQWTNNLGNITKDNIENTLKNQLTYDGQNNIIKNIDYYFSTNWDLKSETNYIYSNNLLVEKSNASTKTTYSYATNNFTDTIKTYTNIQSTSPSSSQTITKLDLLQINTTLDYHPLIDNLRRELSRTFHTIEATSTVSPKAQIVNNTSIQLTPNPSNGLVTIGGISNYPAQIEIYNTNGTLVATECINSDKQPIDLSALLSGVYVVKIAQSNYVTKLIINKR